MANWAAACVEALIVSAARDILDGLFFVHPPREVSDPVRWAAHDVLMAWVHARALARES